MKTSDEKSLGRLVSPKARVRFAWGLLVVSLIGWPVSALTFASGEPQVVLGLSWFAITLTALNVVVTADVRREQDSD